MNRKQNKSLIICRSSCLPIFQLYHYGFGKIDSGANRGAFYHPQFQRGNASLCLAMGRKYAGKHLTTPTCTKALLRVQADRGAVVSLAGPMLGRIGSAFETISPKRAELSSQILRDKKDRVASAGFSNETVQEMQVARHASSGWPILPFSRDYSRIEQHQPPLEALRGKSVSQLSGWRQQRLDWFSVLEQKVSPANQLDSTVLLDLEPRSIEEMRRG
jgi:hypothetical protein